MDSINNPNGTVSDDQIVEYHKDVSRMVIIVVTVAFGFTFFLWLATHLWSKHAERRAQAANNRDVELNVVMQVGRTREDDLFRETSRSSAYDPPPAYFPPAHIRPDQSGIAEFPPHYNDAVGHSAHRFAW